METFIDHIADWVAYSSIIPISLFIYFYGTRPRKGSVWKRRFSHLWLTTAVGQTIMFQMAAWLTYLAFIVASLIWSDWLFRDVMRLLIYLALVVLFWSFFVALRGLQKQPRLEENPLAVTLDSDTERTHPRKQQK